MSKETIDVLHTAIRKCGHVCEYAMLGFLF
jgi:hypothetical protein